MQSKSDSAHSITHLPSINNYLRNAKILRFIFSSNATALNNNQRCQWSVMVLLLPISSKFNKFTYEEN